MFNLKWSMMQKVSEEEMDYGVSMHKNANIQSSAF